MSRIVPAWELIAWVEAFKKRGLRLESMEPDVKDAVIRHLRLEEAKTIKQLPK